MMTALEPGDKVQPKVPGYAHLKLVVDDYGWEMRQGKERKIYYCYLESMPQFADELRRNEDSNCSVIQLYECYGFQRKELVRR